MAMKLSAAGLPLAVMSDGTAHVWHADMAAWMHVADAAFPASPFYSLLQAPSGQPNTSFLHQQALCCNDLD